MGADVLLCVSRQMHAQLFKAYRILCASITIDKFLYNKQTSLLFQYSKPDNNNDKHWYFVKATVVSGCAALANNAERGQG